MSGARAQRLSFLAMASTLPEEILDLIVDYLRNDRTTLKACCLVSQSWVPRTQRHLFARVEFCGIKRLSFESWMKIFPDPSTSPARHARTLTISGPALFAITSPDANAWLRSFHLVEQLVVDHAGLQDGKLSSFVRLRGLSSTLRSLGLSYPTIAPSEVSGLVCSFPLLDDLHLRSYWPTGGVGRWDAPLIPGGLCISRLTLTCHTAGDLESVINLVSRCSETLEFLCICCIRSRTFSPFSASIHR